MVVIVEIQGFAFRQLDAVDVEAALFDVQSGVLVLIEIAFQPFFVIGHHLSGGKTFFLAVGAGRMDGNRLLLFFRFRKLFFAVLQLQGFEQGFAVAVALFLLVFFIFIVVFGYAVIGRCFDDDMVAARHPVEQDFGIGTGFQVAVGHNQQLVGTGGDQIDVVA